MLPPKNIVEHCSEWAARDTLALLPLLVLVGVVVYHAVLLRRWALKGARLAFESGYFHGRLDENKHEPPPRTPEDWRTIMPKPLGTRSE